MSLIHPPANATGVAPMRRRDMAWARVLIVTGEVCQATAWRAALVRRHFAATIACTDQTACTLAARGLHDVLVLDLADPLFDGLALCRQLRVEGVRSPILMLHPHGTLENLLAGFDAGADAYLCGPFSCEELLAQIGALWRRHKSGGRTT